MRREGHHVAGQSRCSQAARPGDPGLQVALGIASVSSSDCWFVLQPPRPFSAPTEDSIPTCSPKGGGPENPYLIDPENQNKTLNGPRGYGARKDCVLSLGRTRSVRFKGPVLILPAAATPARVPAGRGASAAGAAS